MSSISADTLRRIYLLYLVGQFSQGSFGLLRLHKVTYVSEREGKVRPFEYIRWYHGQYSPQLEDIKDQLESMGYLGAEPLDTALTILFEPPGGGKEFTVNLGGNRLFLRDRRFVAQYAKVLASISPELPAAIQSAVRDYGYLKERELLERCYAFPEFQEVEEGDVVLESTLKGRVDVDLSDDECDDLEIAMNPKFINAMTRLTDLLGERDIPWDRIRKVERLSIPGS